MNSRGLHEFRCTVRIRVDQGVDSEGCTACIEIPNTIELMKQRGHAIPPQKIGDWWFAAAAKLIEDDERGQRELGRDLARKVKRKLAFDQSALSRVAKKKITHELVDAL